LLSWPQQLTQPFIFDGEETVGRIGEPIGLPNDHVAKNNSHFKQHHPDLSVPFARVQGSYSGVYRATERYRTPDVTEGDVPDFVDVRRTRKLLGQVFNHFRGNCEPVPLGETHVNPRSAIGYVLKLFSRHERRPWRFKADVYRCLPNLCYWMKSFAYKFGIPVLWETSGKAEILKIKKVDKGDIRTFTFADPLFTLCFANLLTGVKTLMIHFANDFDLAPGRMGVTFVHGTFNKMMKTLDGMIVVKGDCIKWDASFRSALDMSVRKLIKEIMEASVGSDLADEIDYYFDQCFDSYVRMPGGEVYNLLYKKSGDPWTTGGNIMGHLTILCSHLVWAADQLRIDPYLLYLKVRWNIYADDHLNGYPEMMREFLSYESRQRFYSAWGVKLHPPPDDVIQEGPLGGVFLGATCREKYGRYVPSYSAERLLAILYCNSYSDEELEAVLTSIAPLVQTSGRAYEIYREYVSTYFPKLLPLLDINQNLFNGGEGGIKSLWNNYINVIKQ